MKLIRQRISTTILGWRKPSSTTIAYHRGRRWYADVMRDGASLTIPCLNKKTSTQPKMNKNLKTLLVKKGTATNRVPVKTRSSKQPPYSTTQVLNNLREMVYQLRGHNSTKDSGPAWSRNQAESILERGIYTYDPELLDALKKLSALVTQSDLAFSPENVDARAAIAKATGA